MSDDALSLPLPKLRPTLKEIGKTQRQLAEALGLSEAQVSRLIAGKSKMLTRERIRQIEAFTGRTFEYLSDLKQSALSESEAEYVSALRNAPPEVVALIRAALDPYRPKG